MSNIPLMWDPALRLLVHVSCSGQQQIGHLPLGLFDEAKSAPPPPMT